ncbi:hypothetical protein KQI37_06165 [Bacillus halotolerans]|uniref:hypothetical protein n=1 Tax=Bacillus halotolerans TaxID=260554 RepID=UPI001C0EC69D|nr:hypothetical protein [Bacillus halotolerans]MBU5245282.1 hypothetical protein [Bacillus halotolerans]
MSKFIVLKADDIKDHLSWDEQILLGALIDKMKLCRESEWKTLPNRYCVINQDEPYINEVTDIMKKHGHWEDVK